MTIRILIIGNSSVTLLPGLVSPSRWETWELVWSPRPGPADLKNAALVVIDLTTSHPDPETFADLIARTADTPRLAVTAGPAAVPGIDTVDVSAVADVSGEVFAQLERLRVTAKVRWLHGMGGYPFVKEMLDLVLAEVPKSVAGIVAAAEAGDANAAKRLAHQLKSSAANVGAQTVQTISAKIEAEGQSGVTTELRELASELEQAWDRVTPTFDAHRRKAAE